MKDVSRSLREKYNAATNAEFDIFSSRGMMTVGERSDLPANTSIDSHTVLFTLKRIRKAKARCMCNGNKQVDNILQKFLSPTLSDTSLKPCLVLSISKKWHYLTFNATCAFPNASQRPYIKLYAPIPYDHPSYPER